MGIIPEKYISDKALKLGIILLSRYGEPIVNADFI